MADENVDLLIVGAGPAGASLACFLAEYGRRKTHTMNELNSHGLQD